MPVREAVPTPVRTSAAGVRRRGRSLIARAVEAGLPPRLIGWRHVASETPEAAARRLGRPQAVRVVQPADVAQNPLPRTVSSVGELNADAGWWGYSMADVPRRRNDATVLTDLPDCTVVCFGTEAGEKFHPAVLTADGHSVELPQIVFRPPHAEALRRAGPPQRLPRATWILERVYDNHSHWLTAHLPKLVILRDLGLLEHVVLPARRTPAMDASLRLLGMDPEAFPTVDLARPLQVETLTLVRSDRFRPELLQAVRAAVEARARPVAAPWRRVFVSRAKSKGRRLLGEDALWDDLASRGFERVFMEDLDFDAQVRLMRETSVLLAPHGAGLTNMLFCPPGTQVVEIADPDYPNPNFYALAAAMGHDYWLVHASGVGEGHALARDLDVAPEAIRPVLDRVAG